MIALSLVLAALQQPALPPLPPARTDTSPFRRLELPTPTLMREGSGRPGPQYWQQRADYTIAVSLDTATHTIAGRETIRYTNNSPDSLRYLWLQLDQNLFREDSRGSALTPPDTRFAARGFKGGFAIGSVQAVRPSGRQAAPVRKTLETIENGTLLRVTLDRPLAPRGGVASLEIGFSFQVPEHGADRMGREQFPEGWLYEIAQWYPRLAVYDDVRGWNTEQYLGQGEFYLEYGNIDFAITAPRGFIVAGTGRLTNPLEVLTAEQRGRLARALRSDSTVAIIARDEVGRASTRPAGSGPLTWRFSAQNVRDVAWAAAPNFIWDASGWNGILMQSFYPPVADSIWRESTRMVRHSIKHYSEKWFSYPYPTAINVNGPVGGMEYPMIVFCANRRSREGLFGVTTHELGHEWFPMVVGNNERLYAWMDEGFNTFINIYSARAYFPEQAWLRARGQAEQWAQFAIRGLDEPAITPADRVTPALLGQVAYNKPATGLYLLRQTILDSTRFDAAFREYIARWAFKHPTPADFFRSMEDGLGEDLSYFWRGWFLRTDVVDQSVDSVVTRRDSTSTQVLTRVFLSSPGGLPMPVDLRLTFSDASVEDTRLPVEVWFDGNHFTYVRVFSKDLVKVEIDPEKNFPDVRRQNNVWSKPQGARP